MAPGIRLGAVSASSLAANERSRRLSELSPTGKPVVGDGHRDTLNPESDLGCVYRGAVILTALRLGRLAGGRGSILVSVAVDATFSGCSRDFSKSNAAFTWQAD